MKDSIDTDDDVIEGSNPKAFKARIDRYVRKRRDLIADMRTNVEARRGKPTDTDTDDVRTPIPVDWGKTKSKAAQLFSQLPQVVATGEGPYNIAAPVFQKRLNKRIKDAKVGAAMFEVLPDTINAAGYGAVRILYQATTETQKVPARDPQTYSTLESLAYKMGIKEEPMVDQPFVVDRKFSCVRISPAKTILDIDFKRSDFDQSPMVGFSDEAPWAVAVSLFPELKGKDKTTIVGKSRKRLDEIALDTDTMYGEDDDVVCYDEIYYWRYMYHEDEKYFTAIQRMVFVEGLEDPVVNEPWKGQRFDDQTKTYIGACRFPVRILTLDYLTDSTTPPSMSSVIRPTVKEMIRTRQQISAQRDHSKPLRWANVDRIDSDILTLLMEGQWNGFIPVQGDGSRAIGEVARSNYPNEDYEFERMYKEDLMMGTSMGPNQEGFSPPGERTARESANTQANFNVIIGQERARVVEFFLGIADVIAGLMCLYDDFNLPNLDPQTQQRLAMWDRTRISHELVFSIRGDATILLDANQRYQKIRMYLNDFGKSSYINPKPLLEEAASLIDVDPATVVVMPPKPGPPPPKIGYSFKGEDLQNPMVIAMLIEEGQGPSPEAVEAAKKTILALHESPTPPNVVAPTPGEGAPPPMADDRPDWQSVDRVNSRRDASQE